MSSPNFITHGKFIKGKNPEHKDDYIGYLRFTEINGQAARLDIDLMYFRGYEFTTDGTVRFKDFDEEFNNDSNSPGEIEYNFQFCSLRIPKELEFLAIKKTGVTIERKRPACDSTTEPQNDTVNTNLYNLKIKPSPNRQYYGMALLNIHRRPKAGNVVTRNTIPEKTFGPMNEHFFTAKYFPLSDSPFLEEESILKNGKFGCRYAVGYDTDKTPVFYWKAPEGLYSHGDGVEEEVYFHLTIDTDLSTAYCIVQKDSDIRVCDFIDMCRASITSPDDYLGIAIRKLSYLEVEKFNKFGVRLTTGYENGWGICHFPKIDY